MAHVTRPDGARIHYEIYGSGYPLLLIAPGGISSQIEVWERSAVNPIKELAGDFMVIGMDQRHAGASPAPARPFDYADAAGDQLAVLDAAGARRAHVMGGCIGVAYVLNLIQTAPDRISAGVCQDPVGLDETNTVATFYAMFNETMRLARAGGVEAVIASAEKNPLFMINNAAGPFSQRLHDDPAFRDEIRKLTVESYVALVVRFRDGVWPDRPPYFTMSEDWLRTCETPLLVLPGSDPFHPTGVAQRICQTAPKARCLDVDCRSPENLAGTVHEIRAFLKANTPG